MCELTALKEKKTLSRLILLNIENKKLLWKRKPSPFLKDTMARYRPTTPIRLRIDHVVMSIDSYFGHSVVTELCYTKKVSFFLQLSFILNALILLASHVSHARLWLWLSRSSLATVLLSANDSFHLLQLELCRPELQRRPFFVCCCCSSLTTKNRFSSPLTHLMFTRHPCFVWYGYFFAHITPWENVTLWVFQFA